MFYEHISPTAQTIAFVRASPDIPYSLEIARISGAEEATRKFYRRSGFEIDLKRMVKLAPWAKLRLFSLIEGVRRSGAKQILEIAAGLSPGGLIQSEDPSARYLETDLPAIIGQKRNIVETILGRQRKNLGFAAVNALSPAKLEEAAEAFFDTGPIAVVQEGLFPYFTIEEKFQTASNIASILRRFGGFWITADISLHQHFEAAFGQDEYGLRLRRALLSATGRDMVALSFTSFAEAQSLFENAGFTVERHTQIELVPDLLREEEKKGRENLVYQQLWIMQLPKNGS